MILKRQSVIFIIFSACLIISVGQLLVACGPEQPTHQTYVYKAPSSSNGDTDGRSSLSVQWKAEAGPLVTTSHSDTILLQVKLFGPFKSIDDFLHWVGNSIAHKSFAGAIEVAAAPTITTDSWTNKTFTSGMPIPPDLRRGYYDLYFGVTTNSRSGSTTTREDTPIGIHCPANQSCNT